MTIISVIPIAGQARRMQGLPKYLLPVPGGHLLGWLAIQMTAANSDTLYIGSSAANQDLLRQHLPPRSILYLSQANTMAGTVLGAHTRLRPEDVTLFGMPDTYFTDELAFTKLRIALQEGADIAVGVWEIRPEQRPKLGMCRVEHDQLQDVLDKPAGATDLTLAWGVLAWRYAFWPFIQATMPHVGYALLPALRAGLTTRVVRMTGQYWDCGTPEEYWQLCATFARVPT